MKYAASSGSRKQSLGFEVTGHSFKPFHEVYPRITFGLIMGFLFPNPATERLRILCIVGALLSTLPLSAMVLIDIHKCWQERDIFNIIRHSTIVGPFLGAFLKMFLMFFKRRQAKLIIDSMNCDFEEYNHMPLEIQNIAYQYVQNSCFYVERVWTCLIIICISTFPVLAMVLTTYSHIFHSVPQKYMVHDLNKPFSDPEERFDSPYYECMFVYMTLSALICIFNFLAYDGFFGLATNHACMRMRIYCKKMETVFKARDSEVVYDGVLAVIKEQSKTFRFLAFIQDTFNIWLGTICISTMIEIGSLLFHVSAGYGFDFSYTLCSFTAVIHIFLPCMYSAKVKNESLETANLLYCCGWEDHLDPRIRRIFPFLLARAQKPNRITAFYLFDFDMELFMSIMRTSYSMFTLLRS